MDNHGSVLTGEPEGGAIRQQRNITTLAIELRAITRSSIARHRSEALDFVCPDRTQGQQNLPDYRPAQVAIQ